MVSRGFSTHLYDATRTSVISAMQDRCKNVLRTEKNNWSAHAGEAYILAATGLEAFVNETIAINCWNTKTNDLLPIDEIQDLELRQKILLVPLLFNVSTFDKASRPFQDLNVLVRLRNDLVHYRMRMYRSGKGPKYLQTLRDRNVLLSCEGYRDMVWLDDILTFRGAYWAYETMLLMTRVFLELLSRNAKLSLAMPHEYPAPSGFDEAYKELCTEYPTGNVKSS